MPKIDSLVKANTSRVIESARKGADGALVLTVRETYEITIAATNWMDEKTVGKVKITKPKCKDDILAVVVDKLPTKEATNVSSI
jgi:hypothetical protein